MKKLRFAIVYKLAALLRIPIKVRDSFYGATKGCSLAK